jgi:group I intron endonuclease
MYYVYSYTSPSGKKYIGITDCIKRRQSEHSKKEFGCKSNTTKFAQAIRKYGYKNFTFEVFGKSKHREVIEEFEIYYIELFDAINNGYNIASGGSYGVASRKLTKEVVMAIDYDLHFTNLSYSEIKERYKISFAMINKIKNRTAWVEVLGHKEERVNKYKKGSNNPAAKLTEVQVIEIREKLLSGTSRKELRDEYGVSKSLIQNIATNKSWKKEDSN